MEFAGERDLRQRRHKADPTDFQRLREIGVHLIGVPVEFGGTWESLAQAARPICEILRTLARGDSSVALICAMHPLVLSSWRVPEAPEPHAAVWARQRREVFETVLDGAWWGTIISEPGSGGDIGKTKAVAVPEGASSLAYRLTGMKHFGSGSGITSFMISRAIPMGESEPDLFFLNAEDVPWDGSTGMKLVAEWDAFGMSSTNSHAFEFKDFPATRVAWPGHSQEFTATGGGLGSMTFTAVIVGVVDAAMSYIRQRLDKKRSDGDALRAFDQVQWALAEQEAWLVQQAYEGGLRSFENGNESAYSALLAKQSVARLGESVLTRLCQVAGGGAYTRYSPLGFWFEDVRALGFLRPPWSLAFDRLYEMRGEE